MKYFLIGLLCAGVVFLLVSAFLPSDYEIERELVIAAEPSELFEAVADLRSWPDWSAWRRDADPEAEWTIEGEPGPGQVMQWSGPELGAGRLEWVAAEAPRERGLPDAGGPAQQHELPATLPRVERFDWRAIE